MPPATYALVLQDPVTSSNPAAPPPEETAGGSLLGNLPLFALIFAVFYFVMIRPEQKNRRAREAMLGGLKKGDRVQTTGGLQGKVVQVQEDVVTLQVDDHVRLKYARAAVQTILSASDKPANDAAKLPAEAAGETSEPSGKNS